MYSGLHFLRGALIAVSCFLAVSAHAAPSDFPRPASLEPQIEFWRRILAVYSSYELVFHDDRYPQKIFKVLDFRPLALAGTHPYEIDRRMRAEERNARARIQAMLARIHKARGRTDELTAEERRIVSLYADVAGGGKFMVAQHHLRAQRGLREKTRQAMLISGQYLPRMEAIFRSYGLPLELTRLPFIESSFNVKAYSKVGAAGLWQFMPSSAKMYMRLDEVVDDRRDPLFSTEAAARHLRDDYALLQDWGLAVTAYNHGRSGVAKAAKAAGSRDISEIVRRYSSRTFGFASRNFYTEFLAAVDVERNRVRYFGPLRPYPLLTFDEVSTQHYVDFTSLARLAGLSTDGFAELNPAFHPHVIAGRLRVPPQARLRVPEGRAESFRTQYASLGGGVLFAEQKAYYAYHRVVRGDSLQRIARRYGITLAALKAANSLRGPYVRVGTKLRIPPREESAQKQQPKAPANAGTAVASTKAAAKAVATPKVKEPRFVSHRVQRGQTLSGIARRYGTNVRAIRSANNLASNTIKPGQVLKIPAS